MCRFLPSVGGRGRTARRRTAAGGQGMGGRRPVAGGEPAAGVQAAARVGHGRGEV